MFRVCQAYLSSNVSTLNPNDCAIIYTLNTTEATETINYVNSQTNQWIKVSILR